MSKQTLYWTKGLPASGKTTKAKQMVDSSNGELKRINKDLLREMIDNGKYSKQREANIISSRNTLIELWIKEGYNVIVDDTNFGKSHKEFFKRIGIKYNSINVECIDLTHVDIHECIIRDSMRERSVGSKVITRMYYQHIFDNSNWTKPIVVGDKNAIILDIDGTLAIHNGRSPYDSTRYHEDLFNYNLWDIVKDQNIIFLSGREGTKEAKEATIEWLKKYTGLSDYYITHRLYMREEGDNREDSIIKMEIYEKDIKPFYKITAVFDDRSRVVSAWREAGLFCMQVNWGDF